MVSQALLNPHSYRSAPLPGNLWFDAPPPAPGHSGDFGDGAGHSGFSSEAAGVLEDVRRAIERDPETARAAALRLVTFLTPRATPEYTRSRGGLAPWQMRKIDRHLRENLEQSLSLCELADLVSLSVSHFCRAFKDSFGSTPHRYIIRLRLELAQRLMLNTEDPLSQIAIASGHADQAHLCKLFRRGMGETPGAWRRRNFTAAQVEVGALA